MDSKPSAADQQAIRKSQIKLLLVVALFVLPVATAVYMHFSGWRPGSTINHGTLVQPPRPMPSMSFISASKKPFVTKDFEGKWNLLVAIEGACNDACVSSLYAIRQIQIGQGKHQHRVRRILVHTENTRDLEKVSSIYPEMTMLQADAASMAKLKQWLLQAQEGKPMVGARVFMIDPLTNYMMYYAPGFEPAGMRKDLARLLRVSRIG